MRGKAVWESVLAAVSAAFTQPSFALFRELASAWVLCPGRRTVTRMIRVADPDCRHAHDAYHRFLRAGAWSMTALWRDLSSLLVQWLSPGQAVALDLDDTLFHKSGRKIEGAGIFRDAVRSGPRAVVYALGLNLIVLTLRVKAPWGGEPLGLPINLRLYRKGGPSHLDLAQHMIEEVAAWFPDRSFALACDGAFATLAGRALPRTHVTSRMRRDAALFTLPPPRKKGQRGRPAKKGKRLPAPEEAARKATQSAWVRTVVEMRGKKFVRLLLARAVLWYKVCPDREVRLVIVRDPKGKQHDDFFFSTDLTASAQRIASDYAGRWSIEDTFRNVKQYLGGQDPQTWKGPGPERAAALSCWIYSAVWLWYIRVQGTQPSWPSLPWYPGKRTPSFADALATLRHGLWSRRITLASGTHPLPRKLLASLVGTLARAA